VSVRLAQNGAYIAQCTRKEPPPPPTKRGDNPGNSMYTPPKEYAFSNKAAVLAWLDKELA
jgi:hypothetical protein